MRRGPKKSRRNYEENPKKTQRKPKENPKYPTKLAGYFGFLLSDLWSAILV